MAQIAALYGQAVDNALLSHLEERVQGKRVEVFFRADDIGRPEPEFARLARLFLEHGVPLCLAVVPRWLQEGHWPRLREMTGGSSLFCWHQHGYAHLNHERRGRKSEFGVARSRDAMRRDLRIGRQELVQRLGAAFCPVFTPPWNRCAASLLEMLAEEGFAAVSRWGSSEAAAPLPDLAVNIDLHTLRQDSARECGRRLLRDWNRAVDSGRLGIMLHHPCMNEHAFTFLERLMVMLANHGARFCSFRELLGPAADGLRPPDPESGS